MDNQNKSDLTDVTLHLKSVHLLIILFCASVYLFSFAFDKTNIKDVQAEYSNLKKMLSHTGVFQSNHRARMCRSAMGLHRASHPTNRHELFNDNRLKFEFKVNGEMKTAVFNEYLNKHYFQRDLLCNDQLSYLNAFKRKPNNKYRMYVTSGNYRKDGLPDNIFRYFQVNYAGNRTDINFLNKLWNYEAENDYRITKIDKFDLNHAFVMSYSQKSRVSQKVTFSKEESEIKTRGYNSTLYTINEFPGFAKTAGIVDLKGLSHYLVVNFMPYEDLKDFAIIIPVYTSHQLYSSKQLLEKTYSMTFTSPTFGPFNKVFPNLNNLIEENNLISSHQIAAQINLLDDNQKKYFEIGGAKIDVNIVLNISVLIIIALQFYFWVFLRSLARRYDPNSCQVGSHWVGILPDRMSFIVTLFTLVFFPFATGVFQILSTQSLSALSGRIDLIATLAVLGFVCLAIFYNLVKLHRKKTSMVASKDVEAEIKKTATQVRTIHTVVIATSIALAVIVFNHKVSNIGPLKDEYREFKKYANNVNYLTLSKIRKQVENIYRKENNLPPKVQAHVSLFKKAKKFQLELKSAKLGINRAISYNQEQAYIYQDTKLIINLGQTGQLKHYDRFEYSSRKDRDAAFSGKTNSLASLRNFWNRVTLRKFNIYQIEKYDLENVLIVKQKKRYGHPYNLIEKVKVNYLETDVVNNEVGFQSNYVLAAEHPNLVEALGSNKNKKITHFLTMWIADGDIKEHVLVIPVVTKKSSKSLKLLFSNYFNISPTLVDKGKFSSSFPLISKMISKNQFTKVSDIFPKFKKLENEASGLTEFVLLGAPIGIEKIIQVGSWILILLMTYLLIFVRSLNIKIGQSKKIIDTVWLGLLPEKLPLLLTIASAVFLPVAVCILQLSNIISSDLLSYQIVTGLTVMILIVVSTLLLFNLVKLNRKSKVNLHNLIQSN